MGLYFLLMAAIEKNYGSLQVFGDSMLVVNWSKVIQQCHNLRLMSLIQEIKQLIQHFDSITIAHVYKDQNQSVDRLSKEVVQLQAGQAQVEVCYAAERDKFYHRLFVDASIFGI